MIVVFFLQEWADLGDSLIAHLLDMSIFLFFFSFSCAYFTLFLMPILII